jgi:Fe2+ transport system protein FeoA
MLRFHGHFDFGLIYQTYMTINQAPLKQNLIIRSFTLTENREFSEIESRLMHLGFIEGECIRVVKKAPFFKAPLLIEVRGRNVALTLEEAELVKVEVMK